MGPTLGPIEWKHSKSPYWARKGGGPMWPQTTIYNRDIEEKKLKEEYYVTNY